MDLEIIREFTLLADTCNFQLVADRLSLSQSALSKHIHKLEEELGMDLFDRSKRSVSLNENGIAFLDYARRICKLWDECNYAMSKRREEEEMTLRIGLMTTYDHHRLVEKLTKYCAANPNVQVSMFEQENAQIKARLTSGECDFTFSGEADFFDEDEFVKIPYMYDRLILLARKDHPLAAKSEISLMELEGEKVIEHSNVFEHRLIQEIQDKYGIKLNVIAGVSYSSSILRMVHQGIGVALISEGCADQYGKYDIKEIPLVQKEGTEIYIVYKRRHLSEAEEAFLEFFTEA